MHGKVLLIFLIVPLIESHDVAIGLNNYGKKIFGEERQASPAIWRQKENVTIEAAENEMITKVIIIDMRPEKDGDASIIDGGEGMKNVTIELKSPTVLRGYDFYIEVFSAPDIQSSNETSQTSSPLLPDCNNKTSTPTQVNANSADNIRPVRTTNEANDTNNEGSTLHTSVVNSVTSSTSLAEADVTTTITNDESTTSSDNIAVSPDSKDNSKDIPTLAGMESIDTKPAENIEDASMMSTTSDNMETTTVAEYATLKNENTNGKDIPDFPEMIGFNDDDTRHAREVKDFETTSTANDITTEVTTEISTADPDSNEHNESTQNIPVLNMGDNDTRFPRDSNEQGSSTEDGISDKTTELITMLSPESENRKAIQDLAEISGIGADETTQNSEQVTSTEGDITETTTETTTVNPNEATINEVVSAVDETRHARETKEVTNNAGDSSTNMDILTSTITEDYSGDGADLSYLNNKDETADNETTEENGLHVDLTPPAETNTFNSPLPIFGDGTNTNDPTLNQQDSSTSPPMLSNQPGANIPNEQILRNSRNTLPMFGSMDPNILVNEPNYPLFVSPSLPGDGEQPSSDSDYVYVPLIAIVSNSSFPTFQSALESLMQQSKIALQTPN